MIVIHNKIDECKPPVKYELIVVLKKMIPAIILAANQVCLEYFKINALMMQKTILATLMIIPIVKPEENFHLSITIKWVKRLYSTYKSYQ